MKKITLLSAVIFTFILSANMTAQTPEESKIIEKQLQSSTTQKALSVHEKLIGTWKGEDEGGLGYIKLDKEGYATFIIDGEKMGGKSTVVNGIEADMTYTVDENTSPKSIFFILQTKEMPQRVMKVPAIFKFDEDDNLILCMNFLSREIFKEFVDEQTMTLQKIATTIED